MGFASGVYTGADIMMLDGGSNGIQSGGQVGGSGSWTWTLSWNENGFIGIGWVVNGEDYNPEWGYTEADYEQYGMGIASNLRIQKAGCSTWVAN